MARWITQTLNVNPEAQITLYEDSCVIGLPSDSGHNGAAFFVPLDRADANAMAIALRLAAKRLEDIGKGMA